MLSLYPGPVPLIVYSANSTVTWRQTIARCRQTGASSAAKLRAEGEVETKIVFPVPQFWECTIFACSSTPSNKREPDFKQISSLLHRVSLQGQTQPYPQVRHHSTLQNVLLNAQKWLRLG